MSWGILVLSAIFYAFKGLKFKTERQQMSPKKLHEANKYIKNLSKKVLVYSNY